MYPPRFIGPALVLVLAACNGTQASNTGTAHPAAAADDAPTTHDGGKPPAAPAQTATQKDAAMNDLAAFVPAGSKILDSKQADLTGQGSADALDALLVIDPIATGDEKLGEGKPRSVVLLTRDSSGALRKAAENSRIVPCARCGGLAGDPYAYTLIEKGQFTLSISGGSRERWSDDFSFRYSAEKNTWLLDKVVRQVVDTATERQKTLDLTPKEFDVIAFEDFDPAVLPKVGALGMEIKRM